MVTLRRLVAMLLLAVFGLPLVLSSMALGQGPEAGLPACCRRTGAHHCGMTMGERMQRAAHANDDPQVQSPLTCCPYCPASVAVQHHEPFSSPAELRTMLVVFQSQPAVVAQTESRWRIARDRSRHKRGPPHTFSSL
jgi:hypothetical protein